MYTVYWLTTPFGNSGAFQLTKIESGVISRALTADGAPGTEHYHMKQRLVKVSFKCHCETRRLKLITVLFRVAANGRGFHSIAAGSKGQHLHTVVGVFAQSVQNSFTSGNNFGIFAGLV